MKVISQYVTNMSQPEDNVGQWLERIGRVCYKSEEQITEDSWKDFIKMIIKRQHYSVLEHVNWALLVDKFVIDSIHDNPFVNCKVLNNHWIITSNFRVLLENKDKSYIWNFLFHMVQDYLSFKVVNEPFPKILEHITAIPIFLEDVPDDFKIETFKLVTDRGVTHEHVRHRRCAHSQESTRYCNYSKAKFNKEITVIDPMFNYDNVKERHKWYVWHDQCKSAEKAYFKLLDIGMTPQEARSVLPNSLKTEIITTMTLEMWKHWLKLRTAVGAHPQMRDIAKKVEIVLKKKYSKYFK